MKFEVFFFLDVVCSYSVQQEPSGAGEELRGEDLESALLLLYLFGQ